uniref:Spermidine/putrescine import ATP-binding protein potA n=1 Tax=Pyricularia oryzae (strain P131) TaxID=1143193 RepID=L7JCX2_PYRO1
MAEDRAIIPPQGSENPDILAPPAMEEVKNSISISPPSEDGHDGRMSCMGDGKISDHEGQASASADFPPTATAVDSTGTSSSLSLADTESASSGSPPPQSETVDTATGPPMPTINEGEALSSSAPNSPHEGTKNAANGISATTPSPLQPLQSNPVIPSTQSSSATLAPGTTSQGRNILSNRSSAAGAARLGVGAGLGNPKVGLGAGVLPAAEGAGVMAGAVAAGKAESGPGFQKMDHKTTFKHFLAIFGRVFASFTGYYHQNGRTLTNEDFRNLILECVRYLVYLFVARFIFCYVAYLGFRIVSLRISATLRLQYMRAVLSMRVSALDALPPGQTAAVMYMEGRINTPESMIVVLLCVMMLTGSVSTLTTPIAAAARSANAAAVFYRVIDAPRPKTGGLSGPEAAPLASGDLVLTNVNFAYPTRPLTRVLANLSVRFPAGKTTAIVGPSGSGKSTVVALLERWYEMDGDPVGNIGVLWLRNGIVAAGGKPLKEIDLYWWRSQIGLVQQEPFLFNDSIFQNVAYGLVGTEWEGVGDEEKTKLGYNTPVGDAGIKLSGGQRQRLAIARAIVRRPRILILDEATSAIDPAGERVVQAALENAARGRTTIAIAHRLSTIRRADNIVVVRAGVAVEQGTHEQLMARGDGGVYFGLATAQQLGGGAAGGGDGSVGGGVELADESPEAGGQESADLRLGEEKKEVGERVAETLGHSGNPGLLRKVKKTTGAEPKKKRGLLGSFGMLLREQMGHWPWYLVMALGALGGGASPALQAWLFANLVTLFQLWGDFAKLRAAANFWCLMFVMLATGVGISYFALAWSATRLSFYIIPHYRKEYMRNMLLKPISFFDDDANSTGALAARLATDPAQLQQLLGMNMGFVAVSVLSVVGCLAISFYFGWKLTAVTVVTTLPLILGAAFFRVRYEKRLEAMGAAVFAESAKFATEGVGAFRTVSSLTLESAICQRYRLLLEKHVREALPRSAASTVLFALSDSIALLCMAFVLWYGGKLMADHEYLPFQYVVVYIAVLQGGMGAGQWLSYAPNIAQATVAANRIVDLRSTKDDDSQLSSLVRGDLGQGDKGVKLEFNNVWFRYPTRDAPVLNGLDLTVRSYAVKLKHKQSTCLVLIANSQVEKGQFAAVVGPSGSGKTTVISLLERFYNATTGSISYNGVEISHLCLRDYRREISLVAQEACIFDGSIRENILLGVEEDQMPAKKLEEALIQACCDAEIHDFITSLPEGYESVVGTKGVALSGGQRQRLAIARALVRNPRLLLLDEATSSLDSETEKAVQAVFEKTKGSRTMIVVAHRLATVQNADVIFVLGEGKVVEKGNHASLLKKKGVYYQMSDVTAWPKPETADAYYKNTIS